MRAGWRTAGLVLQLCLSARVFGYTENSTCFDQELKRSFDSGEVWTSASGCLKLRCEQGDVRGWRCPTDEPLTPGEYWVDGDPSAPFPRCCRQKRYGCWRENLQEWADVGETWTGEGCTRVTCGEGGSVMGVPCGVFGIPPHSECILERGDRSAEYPGCCDFANCSGCWSVELERRVAVGEKWTLPGCTGQATCSAPGTASAVGCPLERAAPGVPCSLDEGEPDSDDYPSCCPKITCPDCYSETHQRFFGPFDTWTEPGCVLRQCNQLQNNSISVVEKHCPPPPDANCVLQQQGEGDYPYCCPSYQCPEHCFSLSKAQYFQIGDQWTDEDSCSLLSCVEGDNGTASISSLNCSTPTPPPGSNCVLESGYGAEYPQCCPTYSCDDLCFSRDLGRFFSPGDTWTELPCTQITCRQNGESSGITCPAVAAGPGYVEKEGVAGGEYPSCCPEYVPAE